MFPKIIKTKQENLNFQTFKMGICFLVRSSDKEVLLLCGCLAAAWACI